MALPSWLWDRPCSARNSSRRISPGLTGANSIMASVVIDDPDFVRLAIAPPENDSPLVIDPNGMKSSKIAPQLFEPVRWRNCEVLQPACSVDQLELPLR